MVIPLSIVQLLTVFSEVFTVPTFQNVLVLVCGVLLSNKGTISAALRVMRKDQDKGFGKYYRVLNRSIWSCLGLSRILLGLIVMTCLAPSMPLMLVVDDTLERRKGKRIGIKGWFRDPTRSSGSRVTKTQGIRWLSMQILVPVPWGGRLWSLPFMTVPAPSKKTCEKLGIKHQSCVELTCILIGIIRRWYPKQEIYLIGDGAFTAVKLCLKCEELKIVHISRGRFDLQLYSRPKKQPKGKRGRKAKKGKRQPSLQARLNDVKTEWETMMVKWYGGEEKEVKIATGTALWHRSGFDPVEIRWIIVRCGEGSIKPMSIISTDIGKGVQEIVESYVSRWNIEVTFEEMRAQLGFEQQKHWSEKAINRTTPCLFGMFSIIVLIGIKLYPKGLPTRYSIWEDKEEASFGDVLGAIRMHVWEKQGIERVSKAGEEIKMPREVWEAVLAILC